MNQVTYNEKEIRDNSGSMASILNLSKTDVEKILLSEFGEEIRSVKGYDRLIDTLIN